MTRRTALKLALLAASLACSWPIVRLRAGQVGLSPALLAYAACYLATVGALIAAGWTRPPWLRVGYAVVLALATLAACALETATAAPMTYFDLTVMVEARSALGDSLLMFPEAALRGLLAAVLLFAGVALAPTASRARWPALVPPAAFAALTTTVLLRGGEGTVGLPPAWTGLGLAGYYAQQRLTGLAGPREAVALPRTGPPPRRDIGLIVDESVAGRYLDINGPGGVRSGLAQPRPGWHVANFGLAASITNCSVASNYMLRYGGTRTHRRAIIARKPSIWQYARAAGLRTVYLYGQTGIGDENRMTAVERRDIDAAVYVKGDPLQRDQRLAALLAQRLSNGVAEFILVNKYGAHFPVDRAYPPAYARYAPALPRDYGLAALAARAGGWGDAAGWRPYRNSYRNTLIWTVGAFMDRLFARTTGDPATILYTSDHGQDLHERGTPGKMTHCHADPEMEEGVVPLVAIWRGTGGPDWTAAAARGHDASSHYRLFPTLLALMGYAPAAVERVYGPSLLSSRPDPMTFAAKLVLDSDSAPAWHRVVPAEVIAPPAADLASAPVPQPLQARR